MPLWGSTGGEPGDGRGSGDGHIVAFLFLLFIAATAWSLYAFRKLQAAASDEERDEALVLLGLGVFLYFIFLLHHHKLHESMAVYSTHAWARGCGVCGGCRRRQKANFGGHFSRLYRRRFLQVNNLKTN